MLIEAVARVILVSQDASCLTKTVQLTFRSSLSLRCLPEHRLVGIGLFVQAVFVVADDLVEFAIATAKFFVSAT